MDVIRYTRCLSNYIDSLGHSGIMLAKEEVAKQFPNGNHDTLQKNGKPCLATEQALLQFRKDFLPQLVTSGHCFNLNELLKAYEMYEDYRYKWNHHQSYFFYGRIIGYLQRLITAIDAQISSQGV